jgi:MFS transporter, MHS family, proline/betaine transporter
MSDVSDRPSALHRELGTLALGAVVRVPDGASLREVAARFREMNVSSALIGESNRDIVTERDLTQALSDGRGPDDAVESVVERTPVWATTTSHVVDAAQMMLRHEVRHLIVLGIDGRAAGVVSMREIFSLLVPDVAPDGSPSPLD